MMLYVNYRVSKFLFALLFFATGYSQNYITSQFSTNQGLPDNNVYSIFKDKENRLWVGTNNGLALFKGKSIQIFKKKDGLAHNSCWAIVQDQYQQIWIGTFGGGLSLYKNGKFQNFTIKNGLPSNKIRRLFLKGNDLYIGTSNGFSKINIINKEIKNYEIEDKEIDYETPRDFEVLSIIEVQNKIVFNTHSHGIYVLKNDTVTVLNKSLFSTFSLFKKKDSIYIAKNGHVKKGQSINKIVIQDFLAGKANLESIYSPNTIFWEFIETNNGTIYGAADGVDYDTGGLYEINKISKNTNSIFGIQNTKVWTLFYDKKTNLLYVGTLGDGLFIVDLDKKFYKKNDLYTIGFKRNSFFKNVILTKDSLLIEKKSQKISFSYDEIYTIIKSKIDRIPKQFEVNCDGIHLKFTRKGFIIKSIELDNERINLNTNYGLLQFNFNIKKNQTNFWFYSLQTYKFDKKNLFLYFPYHCVYYVKDSKYHTNYLRYNPFINPKYPKNIIDIIFTKKNKFFISRTEGLFVLRGKNPKEFDFPLYYKGMETVAAHLFSDTEILLGTIDGDVFLLNDKNNLKLVKLFDKKEINGNTIYKILHYKSYVLILTESGINIINANTKKAYLIDYEMGIKYKNILDASFFQDMLLVATDDGSYEIDIKKFLLNTNDTTFPYFVDKFYVNDVLSLRKEIFDYDENVIRIELSSKFQIFPNKLLFQYRLRGLKNSTWSAWQEKNTIDLPYVPPGHYELIVKYKNLSTGNTGIKSIKKFDINPPLWQNSFFIVCSIFVTGCISLFFVRRKIDTIRKRELERNNYEKRIIETKMEALQSQMNPHFIFNSLNVIQNFVIKNDVENSITYINNFSKLMRTTLENSSEFKISISDEIKFLKLYVEVQNIRFNNQVKFKTVISPELDKYKKIIPPMLIQPLIENCFEHAFNETISNPKIVLEIKKESNKIVVSVTDNGIGFKEKNQTKAQSKALKLVEERIKLLGKDDQIVKEKLSNGTCVSFSIELV